jgi:hypothetical protein
MVRGILVVGLWVGVAGAVSGCLAFGGNSNSPTKGQELVDLKMALDRGAINQSEYDAAKAQVINRH